MKKIILILILVMCAAALFAEVPVKASAPFLLTSFGQNPDISFVRLLAKKAKIECLNGMAINPKEIDWNTYKCVIAVIGGSSKGLGQAGLDIPSELERCRQIMADARSNGAVVIGMHLGGQDRMGPNSQPFLPLAAEVDFMVVKEDVGTYEYFSDVCGKAGVPLLKVTKTSEIQSLLDELFK